MGTFNMFMLDMAMAIMVLGMTSFSKEANEKMPACAQDLVPCADYLNNTAPCCSVIQNTMDTHLPSLCNLFFMP